MRSSKQRDIRRAVPTEGNGAVTPGRVDGNTLPSPLTATVVDDTHVQFSLQGSNGVSTYTMEFVAPPAPNPNTAPATLASIAQYRQNGTNPLIYEDIPYGSVEWNEPTTGQVARQVFEVYLPSTVAPAGGYPWVAYCHANGKDHHVGPVADPEQYASLVEPLLAKGFIVFSVEFRHPVPNKNWDGNNDVPHDDLFAALQGIRNLHSALNMNLEHGFGYGRSRGNLLLWTATQPDRANPASAIYKERLSTKLLGYWGINTQATYSTFEAIETFIVPSEQAAVKALNPDDIRWKSLYQHLLTCTPSDVPNTVVMHDTPYNSPSEFVTVPNITKVTAAAAGTMLHHSDFGVMIFQGFLAAGAKNKIVVSDNITTSQNSLADLGGWAQKIIEGVPCDDAFLQVRAQRLNSSYWHLTNPLTGCYVDPSTPSPVTDVGAEFGALIDAKYGAANRGLGNNAQGVGLGNLTATRRPTSQMLSNFENVIQFDGDNDRMSASFTVTAGGPPYVVSFTDTGENTSVISSSASLFTIGVPSLANRKVALVLASQVKEQGLYLAARQKAARIFGTI